MSNLVAVSDAARELAIEPARVRMLIYQGDLAAEKVGGRWLVDRQSVVERRRRERGAGRPLAPHNAWAAIFMASGDELPAPQDPVARWRVKDSLRRVGLEGLAERLSGRSKVHRFWGLRGELKQMRHDERLVLSGASASGHYKLGLAGPDEVDAYVRQSELDRVVREHALQPAAASDGNVILRAVPDDAWVLDGRGAAPRAAVALDLRDYMDARARRVGSSAVHSLDRKARKL